MLHFASATTSTKKRNQAKTKAQTNPSWRDHLPNDIYRAHLSVFRFMLHISPGTTWQQTWWSTITSNWQTLWIQKGNNWSLSFPQKCFYDFFLSSLLCKTSNLLGSMQKHTEVVDEGEVRSFRKIWFATFKSMKLKCPSLLNTLEGRM